MGVTIAQNRRARHEFHVEDTFEAGIVLRGTEIKSIRAHKVSLADAYARIERDEAWLIGLHIAPWESTDVRFNHEPKRARKLLLHRAEIDELLGKTKAKGLTLVPLRIYITEAGKAKVELGLARGKQTWDRRREIAERDSKREMDRAVADARRR
jgi:SsrA-binding protein